MDIAAFLKRNPISENFSDKEISLLSSFMKEISFTPGNYLMHEGEKGDTFFLIVEGEVEVLKQAKETKEFHRIALLAPGTWVGEMALFTNLPRSATIRVVKPSVCCRFSIAELNARSEKNADCLALKTKLLKNFSEQIDARLRETNEKMAHSLAAEVESSRKRIQVGHFLIAFSVAIYFYALTLKGMSLVIKNVFAMRVFTDLLILLFGVGVIIAIKRSSYPWSFYGFSLRNWKKYAWESIYWSIPVLLLLFLVKWVIIHTSDAFQNEPLIDLTGRPMPTMILGGLLYLLLVPFQELISRGGIQSCFQNFFSSKHRKLYANIITNLYFSVFHLHQSYILAFSVFLLGLFWGWLYARQGTLVGPCISHGLIGIWSLVFLNIRTLFIF